MNKNSLLQLGIIEGFFGRSWSWQARAEYADFLATSGYHYYIYAPKNDVFLRRHWQERWPKGTFAQLQQLRQLYQQRRLNFGIGLTPYEAHLDHQDRNTKLKEKIKELNLLQPDILCLLFDDMRGDSPQLAAVQCELVQCVAEHSNAKHIIFCPTYYSFDPVLEKVFGARPSDYWETLGEKIDKQIDIFWTGPRVCSANYPSEHLQQISGLLQRKPFLWDNYPVNDSAAKSTILQLRAFNSQHSQLHGNVAGHAVNPMNQPWLSRIPLATLPRAYREKGEYNADVAFLEACQQLCGPSLAAHLISDVELLQDKGLNNLAPEVKQELIKKYQLFTANPFASEIVDWLHGLYAFDPACLTD